MELPDDPIERARVLRDKAVETMRLIPRGDVPVDMMVGYSAQATATAQLATVDLLLVLAEDLRRIRDQEEQEAKDRKERQAELRKIRAQDRREARKDRREARRGG